MNNLVILYSGGLDSLIMSKFAEYQNLSYKKVFFNIGQPYLEKELKALPEDVLIHKLDWLDSQHKPVGKKGSSSGDIYIPGRNLALATLVACIYLPERIWLGALAGEIHEKATDKNQTFVNKASSTLKYVLSPFIKDCRIEFPFANRGWNKKDTVEWALQYGVSVAEILATSSCLSGEQGNCGKCIVCLRRWGIFHQLSKKMNLSDLKETYNCGDPLEQKENKEVIISMLTSPYYDYNRTDEIIPAVIDVFKRRFDENSTKTVLRYIAKWLEIDYNQINESYLDNEGK